MMRLMLGTITGFVLIEVMVVMAIIGILLSVMVPGYQQHVLKSYRLEARSELQRLASLQQLLLAEQSRYTADLTELGYTQASYLMESGRFVIAAEITADGYKLTAKAVGPQLADSPCAVLTLDQYGRKDSLPAADCWSD